MVEAEFTLDWGLLQSLTLGAHLLGEKRTLNSKGLIIPNCKGLER